MTNRGCICGIGSILDGVIEPSGDPYLVECRRGSDKRDAGEGDLVTGWGLESPAANQVVVLISGDGLGDKP